MTVEEFKIALINKIHSHACKTLLMSILSGEDSNKIDRITTLYTHLIGDSNGIQEQLDRLHKGELRGDS
jgi:hypothetical protein